jgi:hypothetical protein
MEGESEIMTTNDILLICILGIVMIGGIWIMVKSIKVINMSYAALCEERKKYYLAKYLGITCCPKCEKKGTISPLLYETGKCSNKDCDYVYKKEL